MKKLALFMVLVFVSLIALSNQPTKKVAIVKLVRGKAEMLSPSGEKAPLKKNMWLKEGTIVSTSNKSFVRLSFIDKSSMNIGPKSSLKIEKFGKDEAGVINVLTGKIRSKVTKDYMNMDKDKSKLFVKSKNAVMGVRGTDFMFSANKHTGATTTVLFEGSIVFNKIAKNDDIRNLESIVNKGRFIKPGEVSVAMRNKKKPTVPAKLNSRQFVKLEKNQDFEVSEVKNVKKKKSVVPPGLSGQVVAGDDSALKSEIQKVMKVDLSQMDKAKKEDGPKIDMEASKGFVKGDDIKPADGVMVHVETGTIIPPGIDSTFDKNTGEWVSNSMGGSTTNGEYAPPEGYKINDDGQLLKVDVETGVAKEVVVLDIKPVDQMPPLDKAPTVEYVAPKLDTQGPTPAGEFENPEMLKGEFNEMEQNINPDDVKVLEDGSVLNPDGTIVKPDGTVVMPDGSIVTSDGVLKTDGTFVNSEGEIVDGSQMLNPDGTVKQEADYLPPPPLPEDCSTCNQPNSIYNTDVNYVAPPPGKTRVRVNVNKDTGGN